MMLSELGYCLYNLKANILGMRGKFKEKVNLLQILLESITINYQGTNRSTFLSTKFVDKYYLVMQLNIGMTLLNNIVKTNPLLCLK